jgi:alcohol dehydrogenase
MVPVQFPDTLGTDFSGIIEEVGENVPTNLNVGDEVYRQASILFGNSGAFAELVMMNVNNLALKPRTLNHVEASGLPLVGSSAWQGLVDILRLLENQKILIHDGAGGIGSIAIQLAKQIGAYVSTTARSDDVEFVRRVGADETIDYTNQKFNEMLKDYDAVLDTVGGETYRKFFEVLKNDGTIVSLLEQPDSNLMIILYPFLMRY